MQSFGEFFDRADAHSAKKKHIQNSSNIQNETKMPTHLTRQHCPLPSPSQPGDATSATMAAPQEHILAACSSLSFSLSLSSSTPPSQITSRLALEPPDLPTQRQLYSCMLQRCIVELFRPVGCRSTQCCRVFLLGDKWPSGLAEKSTSTHQSTEYHT